MSASDEGNARTAGYAPHPYIGGRTAVLRALSAWRMRWPGAPRVIVLTGNPGSGRSRLITGFLMMCDPDYRKQLPLDELDPATVPPDLPPPAVPGPEGRTAAQVLWLIADHFGLRAGRTEDVFTELAAREETVTVVVPDVDRAGPVRAAQEPARLVREVLAPLAAVETVQLLADVPRELAAELAGRCRPGRSRSSISTRPSGPTPQDWCCTPRPRSTRAPAPRNSRTPPTRRPAGRSPRRWPDARRAAGSPSSWRCSR
ncbi:hypothetical protein [Streptomyces endophytica]|uniref:ATP-binding protein n=1 Tax=Streptomyces endophytica TaxID=2991496 RepID=A0ABY6P670_9ACTN|nr:hypothetical protein [Streptomyces endophytica]UZJ29293.1 hypothetical protein OJ254_00765 [Streptomyces endophytica]